MRVSPRLSLASCSLLAVLAQGCGGTGAEEPAGAAGMSAAAGSGASGGSGGSGGSAGSGMAGMPYVPPTCLDSQASPGRVTRPNPLVSRNARATASEGVLNPESATDGKYHDGGGVVFGLPTPDAPAWVAIELEGSYTRLLLTYADANYQNYTSLDYTPLSYRIETSSDSTNGEDGHFDEVVSVDDNPVRTREHAFDFDGQHWVRFVVTGAHDGSPAVRLDELALYDVSDAGPSGPEDTWFFLGDSITAGAFQRTFGAKDFDAVVAAAEPGFTPAFLNGGIGGELATGGIARIDQVLELNPDITHVVIAYGTNDSWGDQNAASVGFEASMNTLVDKVEAAGKVPLLARIPYSTTAHGTLPSFNDIIDRITAERALPCGADLYGFFLANTVELSNDGVHPANPGYADMNRVWGEAVLPLYPGKE